MLRGKKSFIVHRNAHNPLFIEMHTMEPGEGQILFRGLPKVSPKARLSCLQEGEIHELVPAPEVHVITAADVIDLQSFDLDSFEHSTQFVIQP